MTILEQVIKMKGQGFSDADIISELSQQGVSPREINDALKQAQIKYAVSNMGEVEEEMQPSIMPGEEVPTPTGPIYKPKAYEEEAYQPPEYQPQEQYPQEQYYQPSYEQYAPMGIDADTVMEIADQVFSDRIRKIQKQVDTLTESSTLLQTKIENISDRLKKIEIIIDKLQIAILEKVGSYGKNLEDIKKEMSMMQDSFSKMISFPGKLERKREEKEIPEEINSQISKVKKIEEKPEETKRKISKRK
jgi:hypothetical protein